MADMRIKCPTCGKVLKIACSEGENKSFVCPVCMQRHKVSECQKADPLPRRPHVNPAGPRGDVAPAAPRSGGETQYGFGGGVPMGGGDETQFGPAPRPALGGDETQIGGLGGFAGRGHDETQVFARPGYLVDSLGNRYDLKEGNNIVGRRAMSSRATIQIEDPTGYMSRSHASIEVRIQGGSLLHILSNTINKNPSFVNGTKVEQGDQLILNDGDRLKFASTELTFKTR